MKVRNIHVCIESCSVHKENLFQNVFEILPGIYSISNYLKVKNIKYLGGLITYQKRKNCQKKKKEKTSKFKLSFSLQICKEIGKEGDKKSNFFFPNFP